jgi:hypothetical protein
LSSLEGFEGLEGQQKVFRKVLSICRIYHDGQLNWASMAANGHESTQRDSTKTHHRAASCCTKSQELKKLKTCCAKVAKVYFVFFTKANTTQLATFSYE